MSLPLVTLTIVWPASGIAVARSRRRAAAGARRTRQVACPGRPNGSPSSRLPRSPMWPLESANTDSLWASTSRCSSVSRTAHGSTGNDAVMDHGARAARPRSSTTMSAPCARSARAWPTRSTPDDDRRSCPARPASTPASASSNTAACAGSTPSARAAARNVSGAGLPARCSRSATRPSTISSNRSSDPGRVQHVAAVGARRDDRAAAAPPGARGLHVADRALVGLPRRRGGSARARARSCGCRARRSSRRPEGRRACPPAARCCATARNERTPS